MRWIHYSDKPVGRLWSVNQALCPELKPAGLWMSTDGDDSWKAWCEAEGFNTERLSHQTIFKIAESARVAVVNEDTHSRFSNIYGVCLYGDRRDWIDWRLVAEAYDGVVFSPYSWRLRMNGGLWYYGLDCECACVWNAGVLGRIT